ncbi:probable G-protein coupled receptor 139 [Narcine bancroftii]|uniref:probable G-protein coupled receptor 139 n=1 Tax=Narcine bancroftii TaxID=1343680 RepID=UPI003831CB46
MTFTAQPQWGECKKLGQQLLQRMSNAEASPLYAIYYPIFGAVGIPAANILSIVILPQGKCGLSKCITRYLVSMAVADLLVVVTALILNPINGIYLPVSFLSTTPVCSLSTVLIYSSRDCSVWLTVAFTFDRFVAICCQNLKAKYCTGKTARVVICVVCALGCLKNIPWYFVYEPLYVINNVPWFCRIKSEFYASFSWTGFDWFDRVLTPCVPFFLIVLFNALTVRYILVASRARKRLRGSQNGEKQRDPEMETRRKSILVLFIISGNFIILWTTYVVNVVYVRFTDGSYFTGFDFNDPKFILEESGNMLLLLSCCINTGTYAMTQSKFRDELNMLIKYPLSVIIALCK